MKILLLILILLSQVKAFASGSTVGNGGDAVVCYDANKNITSVELYDYYEARVRRNLKIDLGSEGLSPEQKIELVITRLDRINPTRANHYRAWYKDFFKETQMVRGVKLIDVPDTGAGYVPQNCELQQLAVQQEPHFPGDARYVVNLDLYEKMNNSNKAGIVLHELILREAISEGQLNSINARYFHSLLASNGIQDFKLKAYLELLKMVQFTQYDFAGINMQFCILDDNSRVFPEFYDENHIIAGCVFRDKEANTRSQQIYIDNSGFKGSAEIAADGVRFLSSGLPMKFTLVDGQMNMEAPDGYRFSANIKKELKQRIGVSFDNETLSFFRLYDGENPYGPGEDIIQMDGALGTQKAYSISYQFGHLNYVLSSMLSLDQPWFKGTARTIGFYELGVSNIEIIHGKIPFQSRFIEVENTAVTFENKRYSSFQRPDYDYRHPVPSFVRIPIQDKMVSFNTSKDWVHFNYNENGGWLMDGVLDEDVVLKTKFFKKTFRKGDYLRVDEKGMPQ